MKKYVKCGITIMIIILVIVLILVLNIRRNQTKNEDDGIVKIVTSFYPIYIIAENITDGAENIELTNMAEINVGCLHDYAITTEDMKKIENADIFILNGQGVEDFIDKAISSNTTMNLIDSSVNITNLIEEDEETNAHIWTSIENYILQVKNISEGLIELDSQNAEIYQANTDEYIEKLENLRQEYLETLEGLKGKKIISLSEVFEYMGKELELEMTTLETSHDENSTMSAEMLKTIIDKINEENIDMLIIDKNDNDSNANTIAMETGVSIYKLNSGLRGEIDKDAYINQIRENMQILSQ